MHFSRCCVLTILKCELTGEENCGSTGTGQMGLMCLVTEVSYNIFIILLRLKVFKNTFT